MNIIIVLAVLVGLLFATAYFTRRRYGVLGLALCAGYLISTMWTPDVTAFVRGAGVELLSPSLGSLVAALLILLPALALLLSGPTYTKRWQRLLGALAFALLSTSFLLTPLHNGVVLDETGKRIYDILFEYRDLIITVAIVYAVYDLVIMKPPKKDKKGK
jgi:hypothetical protein